MQPSEIANLRVHDLLQLDSDSLRPACMEAPSWVRQTLAACPWVVVRREEAPAGQVAVGVRGSLRSERWGCFISKAYVNKVVPPMELLAAAGSSSLSPRTPPFLALQQLIERWSGLALPWGPTGSVGFELATGYLITSGRSDLDIAIRADARLCGEEARSLLEGAAGLAAKVDVRVETPECGFSLEEYATTPSARILLRYSDGVQFGEDPWAKPLAAARGGR
jgi:phosphoribosyl-dephospho-CoA transferase